MTSPWLVIGALAAVNFVLRAAGPALAGRRRLPDRAQRLIDLSGPALISALVVTGAFAADRDLVLDARAVGLAAATVAVLARATLLVVVLAAAVATALARAL